MYDFMPAIASKACSEIMTLVESRFRKLAESKKIDNLVKHYRKRAAFLSSLVADRFSDRVLVDELVSHEATMDIDRDEMIERFLGPDLDDEARVLVSNFLDDLDAILSPERGSQADRKTLQKVEAVQKNTVDILNYVRNNVADKEAQVSLLRDRAKMLGRDIDDVDHALELANSAGDSMTSSYLRAYYSLCTGAEVDFSFEKDIRGYDDLVLSLVGVAVSAGRLDEVRRLLDLCTFETDSLFDGIGLLLGDVPRASVSIGVEAPDAALMRGLVGLINFEHFYGCRAYAPAVRSGETEILWNPIAVERLSLARLAVEATFDGPKLLEIATGVIDDYRSWFPPFLVAEIECLLEMAFSRMSEEETRGCVGRFPRELKHFGQDVLKSLELMGCEDVETARNIFTWAEARRNPDLLLDAACRLVSISNAERRQVVRDFERNADWAFPGARVLSLYATHINQAISYEAYCEFGRKFDQEPLFHLTAYQLFEGSRLDEARSHIEQALVLMKGPDRGPELLFSYVWVPYLVRENRSDELVELVQDPLPHAPYVLAMSFFQAVSSCDEGEDLLGRIIGSMAEADIDDSRTAEVVARYLSDKGRINVAGRVALEALKVRPTDMLANMVAQWEIDSSLPPAPELLAHITQSDTPEMNIVAAHLENADGNREQQNANLIRAAFGGGEASKRALSLFAIWNAGAIGGPANPETVRPDTYVRVRFGEIKEETLVFPASAKAVKSDGLKGPAGTVYGVTSKVYMQLIGLHVGNSAKIDGVPCFIVEIGDVFELLKRVGFAELVEAPGVVSFSGSTEETLNELVEMMQRHQSSTNMYVNGVEVNGSVIYFGVETGARVAPKDRQLEFVISAIKNRGMPFRRPVMSRNCVLPPETRFLLSYNAIVVLAMLGLPAELKEMLVASCSVTESTKRHIEKDAKRLVSEQFEGGTGRLGYDDGLVMFEYDDGTKGQAKDVCTLLLDFTESVKSIKPSLKLVERDAAVLLADNEMIDIRTASDNGFVYVTEDVLEAQIVDLFALCDRSSVSGLLVAIGRLDYVLNAFSEKLKEWDAQPVLEVDLRQAVASAIEAALRPCVENDGGEDGCLDERS